MGNGKKRIPRMKTVSGIASRDIILRRVEMLHGLAFLFVHDLDARTHRLVKVRRPTCDVSVPYFGIPFPIRLPSMKNTSETADAIL